MDPYERYYRRSLRETMVGQGVLTPEQADEFTEAAFESHEPFSTIVLDAGLLTEYELMKLVATHYQMPVIPLEGFEVDEDVLASIPASAIFQYRVFPLGRFGTTHTFAVVEPPSRECIAALRECCPGALFFFVGHGGQLQQLIAGHVKVVNADSDRSWESIFDAGEERVLGELGTADLEGAPTGESGGGSADTAS